VLRFGLIGGGPEVDHFLLELLDEVDVVDLLFLHR